MHTIHTPILHRHTPQKEKDKCLKDNMSLLSPCVRLWIYHVYLYKFIPGLKLEKLAQTVIYLFF